MRGDTRRRALLFLMVSVGMSALTVQTVLLRELMVVSWGNELVFGIGFSFWLIGVFCGALSGSVMLRSREIPFRTTLMVISALPVLGIVGTAWIRCLHLTGGTPAGQLPSYGVVAAVAGPAFLIAAVPVGLTFPFLVALLQQQSDGASRESATPVYVSEAIGSCLMALLLSMVLLGHVSSMTLIAGTGCLVIPVTVFSPYRTDRTVFAGMILFAAVLIVLPLLLGRWSEDRRWQSVSAGDRITERETPYQLLSLGKLGGQYQLMSNGRIQDVFPDRVSERLMVAGLHAQCPDARRILIVGPVPQSLETNMRSAFSAELISVVLDGQMNRMMASGSDSVNGGDDAACRRITGDVRAMLREPQARGFDDLDLVVLHGSEPTGTLGNRLLTVEFMRHLSTAMSRSGVLAVSLPDTVNYTAGDIAGVGSLIASTVQTAFPHVLIVPGTPHWLYASRSGRKLVTEQEEIVRRIRMLGRDWRREALMAGGDYQPDRIKQINESMVGREEQTNRDDRPVLLSRYARLTGWYTGSGMSVLLDMLNRLPWIWMILPLMLMGIALSGGKRVRLYMPVGILGFTAMSVVLLLVYMFQVQAGSVYRQIALLSGLFMAGLPMGAWMIRRRQRNETEHPFLSLRTPLLLMMTLSAVLLMVWHSGNTNSILLLIISACCGIVSGTVFPVAVHHVRQLEENVAVGSGLVDAFDHLGGAVGALLVASFLIPGLGVSGSLLLMIAVSGIGLIAAGGHR